MDNITSFFNQLNLPTPYYLFDIDELVDRVSLMLAKTNSQQLCYAIKANPFLIPYLDSKISHYEVCSPGELEICRKYGISGDKIIFSGVVKTIDQIKTALAYPVKVVTIESMTQWNLLKAAITDTDVEVYIRVTSGSQFGVNKNDIDTIFEEASKTNLNIKISGIHYFTGTQKKKDKYIEELKEIDEYISYLENKYSYSNLLLEYGPGLSVPYFTKDDFSNSLSEYFDLMSHIDNNYSHRNIRIELGRYIAASCGYYLSSIVDIKDSGIEKYCMIDGGIHHINYYGSNMAFRTPVISHIHKEDLQISSNQEDKYMVCGSLCTFSDIVARGLELKDATIGDKLIFHNIGAYSITEGNYLFLSRDLPSVYIKKGNNVLPVRNVQTVYDINS